MQFDIHTMDEKAPQFIKSILTIDSLGYDCDYISDRLLAKVRIEDGMLVTEGGTRYRALIIPSGTTIDASLSAQIERLRPFVIQGEQPALMSHFGQSEPMKIQQGLRAIRRKNDSGYHYFIANLTPRDINESITLAVPFKDAMWFDPLSGKRFRANTHGNKIELNLRSGQSMILQTFNQPLDLHKNLDILANTCAIDDKIELNGQWTLTFTDEAPRVEQTFTLAAPQTWETLNNDNAKVTMGTGIYTTHIKLNKKDLKGVKRWHIDLGDVRESARVYINGQFIGCAWSVPYILDCNNSLKPGNNEIRIEVTNLPANRIADLDRKGVEWRKFNEINVVDINYKNTKYDHWTPMPSGLNSKVTLISAE